MNLSNITKNPSFLLILAFAFLGMFYGSQALAHAHPIKTIPEANAVVESVDQTCVEFDSKLEPAFSKLNVFDSIGKQLSMDESTFDKDDKEICVVVPQLEAGTYKVQWTAVARDGHNINGDFSFSIK